ncbi:hypothetical protein HYPSUDRAFT_536912 [Hypholoma sublateritium FD-334 SS-4]|uniref:Uncharacterized protein n=1 Tax=Hypholoma sublateritium (strain FD-334 SS-4) TaxID=945553 RepID=A0A0D2NZX9_HYPSF|nr:hypothetical protein HYPSUDRAFT_536912 [Hypholoma sublateritium FD-334 SS-4]
MALSLQRHVFFAGSSTLGHICSSARRLEYSTRKKIGRMMMRALPVFPWWYPFPPAKSGNSLIAPCPTALGNGRWPVERLGSFRKSFGWPLPAEPVACPPGVGSCLWNSAMAFWTCSPVYTAGRMPARRVAERKSWKRICVSAIRHKSNALL